MAFDTIENNRQKYGEQGQFTVLSRNHSNIQFAAQRRLGPPIMLTGREISSAQGHGINMRQMRTDAMAYAKKYVVGVLMNPKTCLRLEIRAGGIRQAIQHNSGPDKLRAIAALPDMARSGTVVYEGVNPKVPRNRLVVIASQVDIGGELFIVSMGFREDANGRLFYDHEMLDAKRAEARLSSRSGAAALSGSTPSSASARLNDYTVSFLAQTG